jgi:MFS family permease
MFIKQPHHSHSLTHLYSTFIVPGEIFPSRVRGLAHGLSAAIGKLGAILSGILFNYLSSKIGVPKVLWIFFACELAGAVMTWFFVPESKGIDADAVDYAETMEKLAARGQLPTGNNGYDGQQHDYAMQNSGPAYHQSDESMKTDV